MKKKELIKNEKIQLLEQIMYLMDGACMTMMERGCQTYMVGMNYLEAETISELADEAIEREKHIPNIVLTEGQTDDKPIEWTQGYKEGHAQGFQQGYEQAIKDMAKRIREMKSYGGSYKTVRVDRVP